MSDRRKPDWHSNKWRLNNLYWITDTNGIKKRFRLNWAQEQFLSQMHYLNVILKARQLGFTTLIQLYMLDQCLFHDNVHAGTIAHTREDAEAFFNGKVRFAYDNLDEGLRNRIPARQDSVRQLTFGNGSTLRIGTSLRSGTFQLLHVSEYGKLCAKFPEKAREVRTGAFNTVHAGQIIFVESTAEGQGGDFYEMCQTAQMLERRKADLTAMDFKFHFFPWWKHPGYALNPEGVIITSEMGDYFDRLADEHAIVLTPRQRAWYVKKAAQQKGDMLREFPSTPDEAFAAAIEGAYFEREMARADLEGRICPLPIQRGLPVETWWDLGMNDLMSIGFVQRDAGWINVIDYYQNSGYGLAHYAQVLQNKQRKYEWVYGTHSWPHDGNVKILDERGRRREEVMAELGYDVDIVPRTRDLGDSIEVTRVMLDKCRFDAERCEPLIRALRNYRREWDDNTATFKDRPRHDWASHPADMMRTGAHVDEPNPAWSKPIQYPENHVSRRVI